jgi:hypothetical protein
MINSPEQVSRSRQVQNFLEEALGATRAENVVGALRRVRVFLGIAESSLIGLAAASNADVSAQ